MRIGIDVDAFRWATQAGIYYYLWNLLKAIGRLEHSHQITLFLYGQPWMDEPEKIQRLKEAHPGVEVQYYWDGFQPKLLSGFFGDRPNGTPWLVRQVDRCVLFPLWNRLVAKESAAVAWLWRRGSPSRTVDLFHHPGGLLFPMHSTANVMTLSDLIPLHLPQYCPGSVEWFQDSFSNAGQMDLILTYSEHTKQDAVATLGIDAELIRVTPLAAHEQYRPLEDRQQVRAVLEKHGLTQHPYVLNIGTLEPRKNLSRLLEAFHQLKQQNPALEHELVLVGAKGDLHEAIWETLQRLQLESQVRWLGYVPFEDLPALLNGADLFVYPSLYEGFGLPPLEAMACGTPVVASSSTSLPEVVGDAGVLVDPSSVEQLAEGMRRVLTDEQLRGTLRDKALRRAQTFSWEKTARLTLAAYEEAWTRSRERRTRRAGRNVQTLSRKQMRQAIITHLANQARQRIHSG